MKSFREFYIDEVGGKWPPYVEGEKVNDVVEGLCNAVARYVDVATRSVVDDLSSALMQRLNKDRKVMASLEEHNELVRARRKKLEGIERAGVLCPKCGSELVFGKSISFKHLRRPVRCINQDCKFMGKYLI